MSVKTYSKKKDGNKKIPGAPHFKIKEAACGSGADKILISTTTSKYAEKIRKHFNKPIHINSGYRTPNYNLRVGGVTGSYHTKGRAWDIWVVGVKPETVAKYAESIGCKGIGCYQRSNFVHIDSRSEKFFWRENASGKMIYGIQTFGGNPKYFPVIKKGSKGSYVKKLKTKLKAKGYKGFVMNDKFGKGTYKAVVAFQKKKKLKADGVVGSKTWEKLYK